MVGAQETRAPSTVVVGAAGVERRWCMSFFPRRYLPPISQSPSALAARGAARAEPPGAPVSRRHSERCCRPRGGSGVGPVPSGVLSRVALADRRQVRRRRRSHTRAELGASDQAAMEIQESTAAAAEAERPAARRRELTAAVLSTADLVVAAAVHEAAQVISVRVEQEEIICRIRMVVVVLRASSRIRVAQAVFCSVPIADKVEVAALVPTLGRLPEDSEAREPEEAAVVVSS